MINYKYTLRFALLVFGFYIQLLAAPPVVKTPDVSDAVKSSVPPKFDDMKDKTPPKLDITTPKEEEPLVIPDGEKVHVETISLEEPMLGKDKDLQSIFDAYVRKELSMNDVNALCEKVSSYYREKGYMLARAYAPKQNIPAQQGALIIRVIIGAYGNKSVNSHAFLRDSYLKNYLEHRFSQGKYITQNDLERTMLLVQRLHGASLPKIALAPGESFGQSNLNIEIPETKRIEGYLMGDNAGVDPSGKYRTMAGVSVNSPLGIGDQFSVGGMLSSGGAVKNGRIAYELPIGYDGLTLALSYSKTQTNSIVSEMPEGTASVLEASKGDSSTYDAKLSYPLILAQLQTLDAYLDMSHTKKENRTTYDSAFGLSDDAIPKNIDVARLGVEWSRFDILGDKMISHSVNAELSIGNVKNNGPYSSNDETSGSFYKILLSYNENLALNDTSNLVGTLKLQKALKNKTLDDIEQLTLSGSNGVKVFTDSDFSVDSGYFVNLEYQYKLPKFYSLDHKLGFFVENAKGFFENKSYSSSNGKVSRTLSDTGIAYYAMMDKFFLSAKYAHVLGGDEAGKNVQKSTYRDRMMLTLGASF